MRKALPLLLVPLAVGAAAVLAVALDRGDAAETAAAPAPAESLRDPAHEVPAEIRTVLVSLEQPAPSPPGQVVHAQLESGAMPATPVQATVLTDEECAPDAAGISHCKNVVLLEDGTEVVLRHPHDMSVVPCLTPGEPVLLDAAGA
jgi:hypothetical protein